MKKTHIKRQKLHDSFVSQYVRDVARLLVQHRQSVHFRLTQHFNGSVQRLVRIDGNERTDGSVEFELLTPVTDLLILEGSDALRVVAVIVSARMDGRGGTISDKA